MSEEEIKKIAKEEFMNNVKKQLDSALIFTYIQSLENQLQQKENIIKEVREYVNKYINRDFFDLEHSEEVTIKLEIKGLLEILDKGNK